MQIHPRLQTRFSLAQFLTGLKVFSIVFALIFLAAPHLRAQGGGIGGYNLQSTADLAFGFDYNSNGHLDHLVLYRPGTGIIWIESNSSGTFTPVFTSSSGIGGYDLMSPSDRLFAFDYDGSGKRDHLVAYRPGTGIIWILQNSSGTFSSVFSSSTGIGGYDLSSSMDRMFAFDYNSSGNYDHLFAYRPGSGIAWVLGNSSGTFSVSFQSSFSAGLGAGIGGFDLSSPSDRIFAYDFYGSGMANDIVLYRPGSGIVWIMSNTNGTFTPIYQSSFNLTTGMGDGIGGYDLMSSSDRMYAVDLAGNGQLNDLVLYRPGTGIVWVEAVANANSNPSFSPIYQSSYDSSTGLGSGIGGYDVSSTADLSFAFDYIGIGAQSDLFFYRPGSGIAWVLQANGNGVFDPVYQSSFQQ